MVQPSGYGLLRPLGLLFRDPLPLADHVRQRCAATSPAGDCGRSALLAQLNSPGTVLLAVLPLLPLLVAALAVLRGRRVGAWLAIGTDGVLALLAALYSGVVPAVGDADGVRDLRNAITAQSALAVVVPLAVAATAFAWRRHCPVLPTRRALTVGAAAVVLAVLSAGVLYVVGGLLVRDQFTPRATLPALVSELPDRLVPVGFLRFAGLGAVPLPAIALAVAPAYLPDPSLQTLAQAIAALRADDVAGRRPPRLRAVVRSRRPAG